MIVSGWTRIKACFQSGQSCRKIPEHLVRSGKPRLKVLLFQNGELLPKGQVFQEEVAARTTKPNKKIEQELQPTEHEPVVAEAPRISMQSPQRKGCPSALHLRSLIVTQPKCRAALKSRISIAR
jgi:hypothetical protein